MSLRRLFGKTRRATTEAQRRIQSAVESGATGLDLSGLGLNVLPPEIGQLANLTNLSLTGNQLNVLPPEIGQLANLTDLWLDGNQLSVLPPEIGQLANLTDLWLTGNQLSVLPPEIGQLANLTDLVLTGNQLSMLPPEISQLANLTRLRLDDNQLSMLPPEISQLANLTRLRLDDNQLSVLPPEIGQLANLTDLSLGGNQLSVLPPEIGQLANLTGLSLTGNQLSVLPPEIGQLTNLTHLLLHGNQLSVLPPEIGQLTNLTHLSLDGNQLSVLPPEIGQLTNLTHLSLDSNQLTPELEAIFGRQGTAALLEHLRGLIQSDGPVRIGQAKVLVLGEGSVGKTSLVHQLCGDGFVSKPSTHGIEIAAHREQGAASDDYLLRYWDFGGQDLYRITHQFFFTPDTLYLIVWNAREGVDRGDVAGWVERIRLRLGDEQARILLVATHSADQNASVDHAFLQEIAGPSIHVATAAIQVDNETGEGIDRLRSEILSAIQQLGLADSEWPAGYQRLSDHLDSLDQPEISWTEFVEMGGSLGMPPGPCESAAIQLAVTGRLTYFKDSVLSGRVILEPDWLTAAISYVLKDQAIKESGGVVTQNQLLDLWVNPPPNADGTPARVEFKPSDGPFLIELMHQYGVAFRLPAPADDQVLVSQRVPATKPYDLNRPAGPGLITRRIRVELDTNSTRPSLIPGLTSRLHHYTTGSWWQNGVVFTDDPQQAWAVAEMHSNRPILTLTVIGPRPEAFFSQLRGALEDRLSEWPGVTPKFEILCPTVKSDDSHCNGSWAHEDLVVRHEMGQQTELCVTCRTPDLPIAQLLGYLPTSTVAAAVEHRQEALARQFSRNDIDTILRAIGDVGVAVQTGAEQTRSDSYSLTRTVLQYLGEQHRDTPRIVSIHPAGQEGLSLNPKSWFTESWNLRLWCEHPGEEHPVDGVHTFSRPREWYAEAAPYLKWAALALRVLPVARYALAIGETLIDDDTSTSAALPVAVGEPAPIKADGSLFSADDLKVIREGVHLTEALAKASEPGGPDTEVFVPDDIHDTRENYNHPSVGQIRLLLHDIGVMSDGTLVNSELRLTPPSPTAAWGRTSSTTADGRQLWICSHHWRHYSSQK